MIPRKHGLGSAASALLIAIISVSGCTDKKPEPKVTPSRGAANGPVTDAGSNEYSVTGEEISYDDGVPEQSNSPWSVEPGGRLAAAFTPSSYPVKLAGARFLISAGGMPKTEFRVRVYGGTAEDGPENGDLLPGDVTASAEYINQWVDVDLSPYGIVIEEGDFFVAMEWLKAPGDDGRLAQSLGADTSGPDRRSWWKHTTGSEWVRIEEISDAGDRDLMIRAHVVGCDPDRPDQRH